MNCQHQTMFVASSPFDHRLYICFKNLSLACPRHVWFCPANHLPVGHHCQASSAWWGFTNACDRHRIDCFLCRSVRCGYCPPNLPPFKEQCKAADRKLFDQIQSDTQHLLYALPPPTVASQIYNMRSWPHNRQLKSKSTCFCIAILTIGPGALFTVSKL